MYCVNSNQYVQVEMPKTKNVTIAVLSPNDEKDFLVRQVKIKNGGSIPNHINTIQHQQFILSGEAKVVIGDKVYHAKKGDYIYIPSGVNHSYEACYNTDYEFLCMITTKEDTITFV